MPYEVRTPMLLEAADMARAAFKGVFENGMEPREAAIGNSSADKLIRVVAGDVRARMAQARIAQIEARLPPDQQPQASGASQQPQTVPRRNR